MQPLFAGLLGLGGPEILIIFFILGFVLVLSLVPAFLAWIVLKRIPEPFRKQDPALAFLLVIPLFSLVWAFFVHPRVAESLQACLAARGKTGIGDCGRGLALAGCICAACSWIPVVGFLAAIAALVLMIVFYVKAFELSASLNSPPAL